MLLDLDSKDIIGLERDEGQLTEKLRALLARVGARLVLSAMVIDEAVEPIRLQAGKSRAMLLLNRLESLPHVWIRSVDLEAKEVRQAIASFSSGTFQAPSPFVPSFLDTLVDLRRDVHRYYAGKPLAFVLWDELYGERTSRSYPSLRDRYIPVMEEDRKTTAGWDQAQYRARMISPFGRKIRDLVSITRVQLPVPIESFISFLWEHPCWCPALRLGFEAWHVLVRDGQTKAQRSDLEDFERLGALPYVDVFMCDKRFRNYLGQLKASASYGLGACDYWNRVEVLGSLDDVMSLLEARAAAVPAKSDEAT